MKLTYFHYYFRKRRQRKAFHIRYNVNPLLRSFCEFDHVALKNSFEGEDGEKVYLLKQSNYGYLFLATRNREMIKALNAKTVLCEDIQAKLASDESVSFASYLRMDKPWYAVAATQKGPKNGAFVTFMNQLLEKIGAGDWRFCSAPVLSSLSRSEVLKLPFVGRTSVEVDPHSSFGRLITSFFGKLHDDEVSSYQVIIKPKPGQGFSSPGFIDEISDEGLKKFVVRAKASLDDELDDFYITSQGALHDLITASTDSGVFSEIAQRVTKNGSLNVLLRTLAKDKIYVEQSIQDIDPFCDAAAWTDCFPPDWVG